MLGSGIQGKTLGIVGLGRIGLDMVRCARAFDTDIVDSGRRRASEDVEHQLSARYLALEELLRTEVEALEASLRAWADALERAGTIALANQTSAGAGGGLSGGAIAGLGARAEPGFALVVELTDVAAALPGADPVITGEGSLDGQSLAGKAPAGIAAIARKHDIPVLAVAGRVALSAPELAHAGILAVRALIDDAPSLEVAHRNARELLRTQASALVSAWSTHWL